MPETSIENKAQSAAELLQQELDKFSTVRHIANLDIVGKQAEDSPPTNYLYLTNEVINSDPEVARMVTSRIRECLANLQADIQQHITNKTKKHHE